VKKKRSSGGGANWMDTYGDMVTLLLCFFVLLYSMSTISEENWKALVMSFNPDALRTITSTSGDEGPNADTDGEGGEMTQQDIDAATMQLYEALREYTAREGLESNIAVTRGDGKVYVTFNQSIFFDGDDWTLREESKPILEAVGGMLSTAKDAIDEVRIMGHTAQALLDAPNNVTVDRMLSAQRAAITVAYIQEHTEVDPARLISEGYGQWRPVADNETPEGQAQNRRVEMIVSGRNLEQELEEGITEYNTSVN